MKILFIIKSIMGGLLLKIFPFLGSKGVVGTQIKVYKKMKKKYSTASKNDLLNALIMSRIKTPLSPSNYQEELIHYESILQNTNKTLEDVILAIVEYEYILSRKEEIYTRLSKINPSSITIQEEINKEKGKWKQYIENIVKKQSFYF